MPYRVLLVYFIVCHHITMLYVVNNGKKWLFCINVCHKMKQCIGRTAQKVQFNILKLRNNYLHIKNCFRLYCKDFHCLSLYLGCFLCTKNKKSVLLWFCHGGWCISQQWNTATQSTVTFFVAMNIWRAKSEIKRSLMSGYSNDNIWSQGHKMYCFQGHKYTVLRDINVLFSGT